MDQRRILLQGRLEAIPGVKKVYFQPPATVKMVYPAIRYEVDRFWTANANNRAYRFHRRYTVTEIDRDPDSPIPGVIQTEFPMCEMTNAYAADNLYHRVFTIYD